MWYGDESLLEFWEEELAEGDFFRNRHMRPIDWDWEA